jgi:uncharacterized protein YgfB (UPF0149 family)
MSGYSMSYDELDAQAAKAGFERSAAFLHGGVLALISVFDGGCEDPAERLLPSTEGAAVRELIDRLYAETWRAIDGAGVGFRMLLPDDGVALIQRSRALIDWAEGFLEALPVLGVDPATQLDDASRAALADIREVADGQADELAADDDEFHEVAEFVWIAVVLVRELLIVHRENR